MKHVAFVIPGLDQIGGAERQVISLAQGFAARQWNVSVIALSGSGAAIHDAFSSSGIGFTSLQMRHGLADPRGWLRFNRWLRANLPDVLHAHLPHAAFLARWSRLLAPVRVVVDTVHTSAASPLSRRMGYASSRWISDCTTTVSQGSADAWISGRAISPRKLTVLPNGVDTSLWHPNAETRRSMRAQLGIGDAFVWLAAGRLASVKNYAMLLQAFASLPTSAAHLLIAGTGPLDSQLRQQAIALGIQHRVHFLGFVEALLPWMQAADSVVLASHWEGLPLVLLEAAAAGLPAVASNVPGSREAIVPGRTGFLCPANQPAEMAAAMQHVMDLPATQRAEIGRRARQRAIEYFRLPKILDRWEALYESLLEVRTKPRRFSLLNARGAGCGESVSAQPPTAGEESRPSSVDAESIPAQPVQRS